MDWVVVMVIVVVGAGENGDFGEQIWLFGLLLVARSLMGDSFRVVSMDTGPAI